MGDPFTRRRATWRMWLDDLAQDVRFGARSARRAPGFAMLAVLTIALGIGVNAAAFGIVKSVLLDALPYRDASRLVRVDAIHRDSVFGRAPLSVGEAKDIVRGARSFARASMFRQSPIEQTYTRGDAAQVVSTASVDGEFFGTLGVRAALGRMLDASDFAPNAQAAAVVGYDTWQRLFAADRGVVGRSVRLEGSPYVIVGVLPRQFVGPMGPADFWVPLDLQPFLRNPIGERRLRMLGLIGRLTPTATVEGARREIATIAGDLARAYPEADASFSLTALSLRNAMVGDTRTPLLVVMASAALVLLIACANLAAALLSRTVTRRQELAVRAAIGAGRGRLVRQLLTEATMLALAGGVAGIALAELVLRTVRTVASAALPSYVVVSLDAGVLLFAFVLALATGVAFGLAPSLSVTRASARNALQEATRGATESRRSRALRGTLVAGQVALSISLLVGAGLLARTLWALTTTPLGFESDGVLTLPVRLPARVYRTSEVRARLYDQLEERLRALPGVSDVATTTALPRPVMGKSDFKVDGRVWPAGVQPVANVVAVSDGYFRAMRIALREGRTFGADERLDSVATVVISEGMARRFWPNGGAIGARIRVGVNANAPWSEVVGIVADVRNDPGRGEPEPTMYSPARRSGGVRTLVIRMACQRASDACDPETLTSAVRRAVATLDPSIPTDRASTLGSLVADGLAGRRLPTALMASFGALALLLASVGVYAMVAAMAAAREREFGVRVALGSSGAAIAGLVAREAGRWMAVGVALGAVGAVGITRLVRGLLFGVSPFDAATLGLAVLLLLVCGVLALVVPVRRAVRLDPVAILR